VNSSGAGGVVMRRRMWLAVIGAVIIAGVLWAVHLRSTRGAGSAGGAPQASGADRGGGPQAPGAPGGPARAVPVAAAPVVRRDVPIYLEGLGNVVAGKTVTIRPQVDGRLDKVLFTDGQAVRRGQLLAQIDPRPFQIQLHQGEGALARDEAQLANARKNLERSSALRDEKLIAQQQVDDQAAAASQLEATVRIDRAAIETARLNLDYARIASPIDGVTGVRFVDEGNLIRASDPNGIVIVTQLDPISVIFTLPQDDLRALSTEMQRGALPVDVLARDGATPLGSGALAVIDNQINQTTGTLRLKATVPNPKHVLWPNQFVNVRLRLTTRQGALVMPATAVQRGPNGTFVYVVGDDLTAAQRPIELEASQDDFVIVAKGVNEGERVVVDGQGQLRPGSKVALRDPGRPASAPRITADGAGAARQGGHDGAPGGHPAAQGGQGAAR
jgi:membrane fusion protein, multidrug efflux system